MNWQRIETAPENVLVMTKIDDRSGPRNEQAMHRQGGLWFSGDTYVYYRPTHWRELTRLEKMKISIDASANATRQVEGVQRLLGLKK